MDKEQINNKEIEYDTKLDELRAEIDKIDSELLPLFLRRMELSSGVADYKRSVGKAVLDSEREKQVLMSKMDLVEGKRQKNEVYEFYAAIMSISRERQTRELVGCNRTMVEDLLDPKPPIEDPKIVFYGADGSYTEQAAIKYFGADSKRRSVPTFDSAFSELESGNADYAVLPIENSYTGTIADVIDLLAKYGYFITGEVDVPIRHCLLGVPGAELSDVKTVYSHEQGIMQSREFLKTLGEVELKEYYSTSQSAQKVATDGDKSKAAIAGRQNAELYGLKVLAEDINNSAKNTTRFIIVSKNLEIDESCDKISAAFTLPHQSGELHRILACFARGDLNLVKLESRPLYDRNFEYMFFVDYCGNLLDGHVRRVTNNVIEGTGEFKLLGNYKLKE